MNKYNTIKRAEMGGMAMVLSEMAKKNLVLILFFVSLLIVSTAGAADKAPPKPGPQDKCPVCGMLVAPYPNWLSTVVFKDGSHAFFDGPKDMFKYVLNLKQYSTPKQAPDIEAVFVTDYRKTVQIDGRKAWYVTGSDVNGPMGRELIPFEKESDAKAFLKDRKGKKILRFRDITHSIVKGLD